jgi:hypothetical protein
MKDEDNRNPGREKVWRRELTPAELDSAAQVSPAGWEDLALDNSLTAVLRRLPEAEVSSNFTARVLRSVELENARVARRATPGALALRWLPRFALACALVVAAFVAGRQKLDTKRSAEMARSVASIPAPSLPADILEDFDAIQVMSRTPSADVQLLALME